MTNFIIIHGSDDNSKAHWFPWMKKQLEDRGYECIAPDFPCEDGHQLSKWYEVIEKYMDRITPETIFISHSRGCAFLFNFLMDYNVKIKKAYLIAPFVDYLWYPKEHGEIDTFFAREFDWKKIKEGCKDFVNYQSDNDPYVPIDQGEKVSKLSGAKYILMHEMRHFTTKSGCTEFPVLMEDILKNLKS